MLNLLLPFVKHTFALTTVNDYSTCTHTHTHTHPFNGPFPGRLGWAGTRKVKPLWILLKQETVSGSGISWAICKSAPCSRQITTPAPHHSVFYRPDALPAAQPTASKHWRHQNQKSNHGRITPPSLHGQIDEWTDRHTVCMTYSVSGSPAVPRQNAWTTGSSPLHPPMQEPTSGVLGGIHGLFDSVYSPQWSQISRVPSGPSPRPFAYTHLHF